MRIEIVDVIEDAGKCFVTFHSVAGQGVGRWAGSAVPTAGSVFDVEADIYTPISLGGNARASDGVVGPGWRINDPYTQIVGIVEEQDEDGVFFLRVSNDCLMMLETNEANLNGMAMVITVAPSEVALTPFGS